MKSDLFAATVQETSGMVADDATQTAIRARPVPRRAARIVLIGGAIAAIAALTALTTGALVVHLRDRRGAPPAYAIEVSGVDPIARGSAGAPRHWVRSGARLTIVLRPPKPTREDLEAVVAVDALDGAHPSGVEAIVGDGGLVRVEGDGRAMLADAHGAVDFVIAVGPRGTLPHAPREVLHLLDDPGRFITRVPFERE